MSASTPLGGRSYPAGAAGTHLANGLMLAGDDADAFTRAGYNVLRMEVLCSARIAAGDQSVADGPQHVTVAIDRNGRPAGEVAALAGLNSDWMHATGVYDGTTAPAVVGYIPATQVIEAHERLRASLPGFGCFAVLR